MTAKRINITVDEETLQDLDATAKFYGMKRSECIAFMFEVMNELNAFEKLEEYALQIKEEKFGTARLGYRARPYAMKQAARQCRIIRENQNEPA